MDLIRRRLKRNRLPTDTKISVVSVSGGVGDGDGVGESISDTKTVFLQFEKKANKVGFRIKKYLRHLKTLVSVSVSDFPTTQIVVPVSV